VTQVLDDSHSPDPTAALLTGNQKQTHNLYDIN
jgi:hypothetical protein